MKSSIFLVLAGMLIILMAGCAKTLPVRGIPDAGSYDQELELMANGFKRTYRIHVPPGYDGKTPLPLVVVIHGAFDTAEGMETFSNFSTLSDQKNFLVLYPNGMGLFGYLQHWNAGHCCGKAAKDKIDDVGFIEAAILDACDRLKVDRKQIFVLGFSNGGMMACRFAAEKTQMLAGAAFLAASIGGKPSENEPEWRIPAPRCPLPVLIMHGMDDQDVPFEGGVSKRRGGPRTYWSVMDSTRFWVSINGCGQKPATTELRQGRVEVTTWKGCKGNTAVALYQIKGWAHDWPGPYFTDKLPDGDPLKGFDASKIIWHFFETCKRETDH